MGGTHNISGGMDGLHPIADTAVVPHRVQIVTRDGVRDSAHLCPGGGDTT